MDENIESFKKIVQNPESLSGASKEYWLNIQPILFELLDELEANGKVKHVFVPAEMKHMGYVLNNIYQLGINNNWLLNVLFSKEKLDDFLATNQAFGLDFTKAVNLYIQSNILATVLHTELAKTVLLFHLVNVNPKTSCFSQTIKKSAPKAWKKLEPHVNNALRNSLAHGTWAIENGQVILFKDSTLVPYEKLNFDKFVIEAKKCNIVYSCMVATVVQRFKEGFFVPLKY